LSSLLEFYEIPVRAEEEGISKFQKLCTFAGVSSGAAEFSDLHSAVADTRQTVKRLETAVKRLETKWKRDDVILTTLMAHFGLEIPALQSDDENSSA